ncbi:MAG: TIGR03985 family CRISPR-associated protein [Cyanobacteria bacterium J06634_5]
MFTYPPTPEVLHWLAKGRLADRCLRAVRLWHLLQLIYGKAINSLPQPFRYGDVRDRLFANTHGTSDNAKAQTLSAACRATCSCQQSLTTLLEQSPLPYSLTHWQQKMIVLTDLDHHQLTDLLQQRPFSTVHRSIRADLAYLAELGWLKREKQGRFSQLAPQHWPKPPEQTATSSYPLGQLSVAQTWEMLRSLESIAFVQPNLEIIIQSLWEQLTEGPATHPTEPEKRIFIHLDYILSDERQEQVDTLQEQIEQLWHQDANDGGGVIHFDYWRKSGKTLPMTVYPVCLHYARRAKYLSAYGQDPAGDFTWHNYRLDRIASPQLKILPWNDPDIPTALLAMKKAGNLPTSKQVETYLEAAWGFNFYLPRRLLIMRFPSEFARWYVHETDRHQTFVPVAYEALPRLVKQEIADSQAQEAALNIIAQRSPEDVYYQAWIRLGDINIVMRLRDWRPNGEVISPLALRAQMKEESAMERSHYTG